MNCLMFGLACDQEQFEKYTKDYAAPYSVAHYLFEKKIIEEMEKDFNISHRYIFQSNNRSFSNAIVKSKNKSITKKTDTIYLSYFNMPIIKFFSLFFSTISTILKFRKKHKKDFFIISTINYFPVALATVFLSKLLKYKNIAIFTDWSVGYAYDKTDKGIKNSLRQFYKKAIHILESKYDGYVLFSEPMNELVNPNKKPYCVMEGFFNPDHLDLSETDKYEDFTMVYAGTIIESVGLQNFVKALSLIDNPTIKLKIYGDGDYKKTLMNLSANDNRISFHGFVDHKEIFEIEKAASLMINVRDPNLAYTKYSFPSKTFEYLASGTPFLSSRLQCYPPEYEDHILFIDNNEPETIAKKLTEILSMPKEKLNTFGLSAKSFVLSQKNPLEQSAKIIRFIKEVHNVF